MWSVTQNMEQTVIWILSNNCLIDLCCAERFPSHEIQFAEGPTVIYV